jgi:hypothetical protein
MKFILFTLLLSLCSLIKAQTEPPMSPTLTQPTATSPVPPTQATTTRPNLLQMASNRVERLKTKIASLQATPSVIGSALIPKLQLTLQRANQRLAALQTKAGIAAPSGSQVSPGGPSTVPNSTTGTTTAPTTSNTSTTSTSATPTASK